MAFCDHRAAWRCEKCGWVTSLGMLACNRCGFAQGESYASPSRKPPRQTTVAEWGPYWRDAPLSVRRVIGPIFRAEASAEAKAARANEALQRKERDATRKAKHARSMSNKRAAQMAAAISEALPRIRRLCDAETTAS